MRPAHQNPREVAVTVSTNPDPRLAVHLARDRGPPDAGAYEWAIEYGGECIGSARLVVDPDQHCATYAVGVFVADYAAMAWVAS